MDARWGPFRVGLEWIVYINFGSSRAFRSAGEACGPGPDASPPSFFQRGWGGVGGRDPRARVLLVLEPPCIPASDFFFSSMEPLNWGAS